MGFLDPIFLCHHNKSSLVFPSFLSQPICVGFILTRYLIPHSFLSPGEISLFLQTLESREMSSLPFSLASPAHTKQIRSPPTFKTFGNNDQKFSKKATNEQLQVNVEKTSGSLLGRREAIGFGLCLTALVDFLGRNVAVAAEATAPCEFTTTPSGLAFCDKVVGFGPEASKGQLIKAHYTGKLENGKVFDSSYNRGKPLTFRIGVGEVIKGWDQGILGGDGVPPMLAGGKRTLKLPPQLGYGMRGAGCKGGSCIIPPDSILLFDVEFIGKA